MSRRRPLQPNAALAEMMARDAEAAGGEPFGGYAGESITGGPSPPSPPPPRPRIPRPPWAEGGEPDPPRGERRMIAAGMILDRLGAVARTTGVPDRTPTGPGFRVKTTYGYDPLELRSRLARLLERARAAAERRRPGEPIAVEDRSAPAPPVEEYEPVGPIRYGPPGRILSVR